MKRLVGKLLSLKVSSPKLVLVKVSSVKLFSSKRVGQSALKLADRRSLQSSWALRSSGGSFLPLTLSKLISSEASLDFSHASFPRSWVEAAKAKCFSGRRATSFSKIKL